MPGMMRCFGTYLAADEVRVDGFDAMGLGTFPMATVSLVMKLDADPELPGGRYTVGLTATAAAAEVLAVAMRKSTIKCIQTNAFKQMHSINRLVEYCNSSPADSRFGEGPLLG